MMAHGKVGGDVWIGTSLGILKGLTLDSDVCLNYLPSGVSLDQTDRSREVLCMCWGEDSNMIYTGLKNGQVQCFDTERKYFCSECDLDVGCGQFIGISRHKGVLITCTNDGILAYWPDGDSCSKTMVGGDVCSMCTSCASDSNDLLVATGGKENDLKVWDGNRPDALPIFKARNVPHDYLNLRVPIWVRAIGLVPSSNHLVAVATAHHQLRLYDSRAQRRPVYSHSWGNAPFTCLDVTRDGRYYLVGTSHGSIARVDLRKGNVLNKYHGFSGSIKGISCYDNRGTPVFGACGLDRYFRVYTMDTPTIIYKKYLKLFCNCLLVNSISLTNKEEENLDGSVIGTKRSHDLPSDGDDDLWDEMDLVEDKKKVKNNSYIVN